MIVETLRTLALSTLASSAAILVVLLLRKPLRLRFGAQIAYALWALVPLAALVALLPAPVAAVAPMPAIVAAMPAPMQTLPLAVEPTFDLMPWLALVWLLGTVGCAVSFVRQQRRFVRSLGHLSSCDDGTTHAQTTAGCPALVGAWRPRIVLPADFERRYDNAERELILAHERAHRARGDAQANALAAALRCLYWFNPLFHFAASRFRFDQELACDAIVISRFPEARRSYADAMLKTQLADLGLPAGCHWQSSHPLKERIAMLKQPLPGRARRWIGGACVAAIVAATSFAAWAAQPAAPAKPVAVPAAAPSGSTLPDVGSAPQAMHASYRRISRIDYPASAIAAKLDGIAYVRVNVSADGRVADINADSVHPMSATQLADAAVAAVKSWTFNPALRDGKPTASVEVIPIAFTLDPKSELHLEGGTLDAIRVSPPLVDAVMAAGASVSEDVQYRRAHPPHYPASAIKAHKQGEVTLKVLVDAKGDPVEAKVAKTDPPDMSSDMTDSAIAAVMQWKFNPARKHGKAVDGWVNVPITFSLTEM